MLKMSQDLLAELDEFYTGTRLVQSHTRASEDSSKPLANKGDDLHRIADLSLQEDDNNDDFGDFEEASKLSSTGSKLVPDLNARNNDTEAGTSSPGHAVYDSAYHTQSNDSSKRRLDARNRPQTLEEQDVFKAYQKPKQPDSQSNVLFDADVEFANNDSDDFREFSPVHSTHTQSINQSSTPTEQRTLVPLQPRAAPNTNADDWRYVKSNVATKKRADKDNNNVVESIVSERRYKTTRLGSLHMHDAKRDDTMETEDEGWADFETTTPVHESAAPTALDDEKHFADTAIRLAPVIWMAELEIGEPPTNIPPPALLLTLFPSIFSQVGREFFTPLSKQDSDTRESIFAGKTVQVYISSVLELARVLAYIIAGRKLRWKRDTRLSQSMRIGQATGKGGGMKLVGIDRAENAREEREVADVLKSWHLTLGKIRAVAATRKQDRLPDISESPTVRIATEADGGLAAPKPCLVCGLKRNERVIKVDYEVNDSFGEWWVEHCGHKSCFSFWYVHKNSLLAK